MIRRTSTQPPIIFDAVGDRVVGRIVTYNIVGVTDLRSGKPERMMCFELDVDGSTRALWLQSGRLASAVKDAYERAGVEALDEGGVLAIKYIGNDATYDEMDFVVTYKPPTPSSKTESPMEEKFWKALTGLRSAYGKFTALDGIVPQVKVGRYRVDFGDPTRRVAIEIDGFDYHSSREHLARDRERQRALETAGWRVCRFSGSEVNDDAEKCVRETLHWLQASP